MPHHALSNPLLDIYVSPMKLYAENVSAWHKSCEIMLSHEQTHEQSPAESATAAMRQPTSQSKPFSGRLQDGNPLPWRVLDTQRELCRFSAARVEEYSRLLEAVSHCRTLPDFVALYPTFYAKAMTDLGSEIQRLVGRFSSVMAPWHTPKMESQESPS